MKKASKHAGVLVVCALLLPACYGSSEYGGSKASKSPAVGMALMAPKDAGGQEAAAKNDDGVLHLKQEHWDTAAGYFREAIEMDPELAEAHFNLGLSLDAMGSHQQASQHFKKAKELAPDNPAIAENEILLKHL